MPASSAKTTTTTPSGWTMLWTVVMWILVILVVVYVSIGIAVAFYYYQSRRSLQTYTMNQIKKLSEDTGDTYDFTVDARGIRSTNHQLAKDVVRSLMQYYGNNLNTVRTILQNYTVEGSSHLNLFASVRRRSSTTRTMVVPDVFSTQFQEDATAFVAHTSSSFPPEVLSRTQFFSRFFSMVFATVSDPAKADAIAKLWEWIHEQSG